MVKLKGKKFNFLGDSITEGAGASEEKNNFVNVFKKISKADCVNYGIGGTRIAKQIDPKTSEDEKYNKYFASRIAEMRVDADYIIVFGGTNDFGHGDAPFGAFGDKTPETFYGALYDLYFRLYEKYPNSKIIVITPLHRISEDALTNDLGLACKPLKDYVNAVKEMAGYFSIPVLDLYSNGYLTPKMEIINKQKFFDGLHPNDVGHRIIAEKLLNFINQNDL